MKRSITTPAGMSIIDIAVNLKAQDPSLSFSDARDKAKEIKKAQDTINHAGGKLKHTILTKLFGKRLGNELSHNLSDKEKMDKAVGILADYKKTNAKADKVPNTQLKEIMKKLNEVDTAIKELKIVKVAAPTATAVPHVESHRADHTSDTHREAHQALAGLGFKKGEAERMLANAPEGANVEELIRHALSEKKKAPAVEKVPQAAVPAEIARVTEEVRATPAAVSAPMAQEVTPAPSNIPVLPPKPKTDDTQQSEAISVSDHLKQAKKEKEADKKQSQILKDLEDIKKHLPGGGIEGLLGAAIATLAAKYLMPFITKLGELGTWFSTKIHDAMDAIANFFHMGSSPKARADALIKKGVPGSQEDAIAKGKTMWVDPSNPDLMHAVPKELRIGPAYNKKSVEVPHKATKSVPTAQMAGPKMAAATAAAVAPMPVSRKVADQVTAMPSDDGGQSSSSHTVIAPVVLDNTKMVAAPKNNNSVLIKVRNDEPSVAGYAAEVFDHPVAYGGVYRM